MEVTLGETEEALRPAEPRIDFSGEEAGGKCLDLHALFLRFQNAKFGQQQLDYAEYVSSVADFDKIQRSLRASQPYRLILFAAHVVLPCPATVVIGEVLKLPADFASARLLHSALP